MITSSHPCMALGVLGLSLFAANASAAAFPPSIKLDNGIQASLTANFAWDVNRIHDPAPGMADAEGWRRREIGFAARKDGVFDVNAFYDQQTNLWLDAALRVETQAVFGKDIGRIRVGNMKLHAGLEGVAGNRHAAFMENSMATQVFFPGARAGLTWSVVKPSWMIDMGTYGRDFNDANGGGTQLLRAVWTPRTLAGGQGHFGIGLTRDTPNGTVNALGEYTPAAKRWANRASASLSPVRHVDTGLLTDVDTIQRQNIQTMWLQGPLWVQGEYFFQQTERLHGLPDYRSDGGHAAAGWVINAKPRRLAQGMLMNPSAASGQIGTELVARYGHLNLDRDAIHGGHLTEWSLGANVYIGPYVKLQADMTQTRARRSDIPHSPRTVQLRTQFYF